MSSPQASLATGTVIIIMPATGLPVDHGSTGACIASVRLGATAAATGSGPQRPPAGPALETASASGPVVTVDSEPEPAAAAAGGLTRTQARIT